MCQPKDKGGRRCPTHQPASIGLKKFMVEQYGMLPEQVEHTFKTLRNQASDHPLPSPDQYQHFVDRNKAKLTRAPRVSDKGKRSIERQLSKELAESELPDGATFFALKKLQARVREQKREFVQLIRQVADHRGTNRNEALQAFKDAYSSYDGEDQKSDLGESFDARTKAVMNNLLSREGTSETGMPEFSETPRITREPLPHGSTWINGVGYDPDDGRLEVDAHGNVYAYHNVPQSVWNEIQTRPDAPSYISRNILRNREYQYESSEASARDAYGRYCEDCHKYRAISGHVCDAPGARQEAREEEERLATAIAMSTAEEDAPPEEVRATYEAALERIRANMVAPEPETPEPEEATQEEEPAPRRRRQRRGPTARQRRWMAELSERETVDLNSAEPEFYAYRVHAPKATEIRRAIVSHGDIATFDVRQATQVERDEETGLPAHSETGNYMRYTISSMVEAHVEGEEGSLKMNVKSVECDCSTYARHGECKHTRAYTESENLEESLGLNRIHKSVLPESYLREQAEDGVVTFQPSRTRSRRRMAYSAEPFEDEDGNQHRMYTDSNYTQADWRALRNTVDSGVAVRINSFGVGFDTFAWDSERWVQYSYRSHRGPVEAEVYKDEDGNYAIRNTNFQCYRCGRSEASCPHQDKVEGFIAEAVNGNTISSRQLHEQEYGESMARNSAPAVDYESLEPAQRLDHLNESIDGHWMSKNEDIETIDSTFGSGDSNGYSKDIDRYVNDVQEAKQRIKDTREVVPFTTEPVTGGVCSPESGRGFGLEIEFDLPSGANPRTVGAEIARELHEQGLSDISHQTHYHGYSGNQWHIEEDCTVSGEIVSPILNDTPEQWEQVQKVCDIVKRHGGKSTANTGGHVHMGLGRGSEPELARRKAAVTQVYAAFEDSIRRVQADPTRKEHRDSTWCRPLDTSSAQSSIYQNRSGREPRWSDHHASLNMGHQGRIEFRGADGSIDPGHIQAQVMMSAGVVRAAERGEVDGDTLRHAKVGSNAKKIKAIQGVNKTKVAQTDDELVVSDVEFRKFSDLLMNTPHGRKAVAGIAANTPWQETRY